MFAGSRTVLLALTLLAGCSSPPSIDQGPLERGRSPDQPRLADAAPDSPSADLGRAARCLKLVERYRQLLEQAKRCTLQAGQPQCQLAVDDAVGCGCMTSVEASQKAILDEMGELASEWKSLTCFSTCPAPGPACTTTPKGACVTGGQGPRCEDQST